MTRYVLLWFEAPLQSWGADSKFGRRDTLPFPTRSGVLGLILCAMGRSGEQRDLLKRFADLPQTIYSYISEKREPFLRDFQMVGSGYDDRDPWETLLIPKTSEGKKAVGGGTKMTYRYYLQDARFGVVIELPADLVAEVSAALKNPEFDIYLGRKTCVPTDFVWRGEFGTYEEAEDALKQIVESKGVKLEFTVLDGDHPDQGDAMTLNDVPIQFGTVKQYQSRRVTVKTV